MLIIRDSTDLFNSKEKEILEKKCKSFAMSDMPNQAHTNHYVREHISNDDAEFQTIISKINECISKLPNVIDIKLDGFWINKITNETNKKDRFHKDISAITFLMYLNDGFTGGEYEYVISSNRKKEKLKPKKYLSIITDRSVEHRVNPVIEGERYSIVFFYDFNKKVNKTLI